MRRLLALLLSLAALVAGGSLLAAGPATAQLPPDDPRLGLVYDGLRRAQLDSLCGGAFEAVLAAGIGSSLMPALCTHGPDPAPDGVDVREDRKPDPAAELAVPAAGTAGEAGSVPCYGDGTGGYRVQVLYASGAGAADRFPAYAASFRSWAARLDGVVNNSAAETGGTRHVRFVTDSACDPVVERVTLSPSAMSTFANMVSELQSLGYTRTDRKYLVWADTNVYCGISSLYIDDRGDPTPGVNDNNGAGRVHGTIGRVDNGCWGRSDLVEAHELAHLLGGVQPTAPHATPGYHCTDESDRLCYADGTTSTPVSQSCPVAHEALYDCNHDDYFSTAPPPGSYLATHWNTANSAFLTGETAVAPAPAPPPTTLPPPTTVPPTTSAPPATTATTAPPTTSAPPPTTATTLAPPTTTATTVAPPPGTTPSSSGLGPAGAPPSAPQAVTAMQPTVGQGVLLSWQPPATGPVDGYRIYRGTSPYSQTLLATVQDGFGYDDVSAGRTLYYYRVTAFNAAGESPPSTLTRMIGRTARALGVVREAQDRRLTVSNPQLRSPLSWRWP